MSLEGKTFVIELGDTLGTLPFTLRNKLVHDIQSLGGKVSSVVTEDDTFAVISRKVTPEEFDSNLNLQYAVRYNAVIVSQGYIEAMKDFDLYTRKKAAGATIRTASSRHHHHSSRHNSKGRSSSKHRKSSSHHHSGGKEVVTTVANYTTSANNAIIKDGESNGRVQLRLFAIPLPSDSIELRNLVSTHLNDRSWTERAKATGNLRSTDKVFSVGSDAQFAVQSAIIDHVAKEHFKKLPESKHQKVYNNYDETTSEIVVEDGKDLVADGVAPPFPLFPNYTVARVSLFADDRAGQAMQIELQVATRRIRLTSFADSAKFAGSIEDKDEEEANLQNKKRLTPAYSEEKHKNHDDQVKIASAAKGPTFIFPFRIVKYVVSNYANSDASKIAKTQICSASFALTSKAAEDQFEAFYGMAVNQMGAHTERLLPYFPGLGSKGVSALAEQRTLAAAGGSTVAVAPEVEQVVSSLFTDTWNLLKTRTKSSLLSDATNMSISLADMIKAEAALTQIGGIFQKELERQAQMDCNGERGFAAAEKHLRIDKDLRARIVSLCEAFFSVVKSEKGKEEVIETVEDLQHWEDVTRALKSLLNVGEASASNLQVAHPRVQYGALGCRMSALQSLNPATDLEAREILRALSLDKNLVASAASNNRLLDASLGDVLRVFSLERADETREFEKMARKIGGNRLLVHGTNAGSITSILSTGLMVPKAARLRRDAGMLGRGIYFGDCAQTALRYVSKSSNSTNSVFILVSEVALGATWVTDKHQLNFTAAPPGYHSVQGMQGSIFADNEYVIYNSDQVRLRYLIEVKPSSTLAAKLKSVVPSTGAVAASKPKPLTASTGTIASIQNDQAITSSNETVSEEFKAPAVKDVKPGLQSNSGTIVPLQKTHVKGRVLDMIGEFTVLQEYFNGESKPIEAKYVFPLQSGAAVCGFEAYINDKKVVGVVKEKEKARKEYQAAVARGDGAYLMDESEESPDVFTISVGNLPGKCRVVIKIVYIIELNVDPARDAIEIRVPSEVHPATKDTELRTVTQKSTVTRASTSASSNVSIDLGFDMPFEIVAVECNHPVRRKRTVCRANITCENADFAKNGDFVAYVKMSVMKNPRIWVEEDNEKFTTSAMITFFPDIDTDLSFVEGAKDSASKREVLLLLDGSASMKNGSSFTDAKNAAILTLKKLPATWNFNVAVFGSSTIFAFPRALSVSDSKNLSRAISWVQRNYAPCFGGTDLKAALSGVSEMLDGDVASQRRQIDVLLFSDGHLPSEEAHTFRTIRDATGIRVFPFAVGSNCSATTLFSVARVGRGRSVVLSSGLKSAWPGHIIRQLTRSAHLALTNINVDWTTEPNKNLRQAINESVVQSPRHIPSVFTGENTILYGACTHQARQCELIAKHTGVGVDRDQYGDWPEQRMIVTANTLSMVQGRLIHRLAAKARIRDWTEGAISAPLDENGGATTAVANETAKAATKQSIIDLGCEFGLVTPFTSMVAIEERSEEEKKKQVVDQCTTPPVDLLAQKIVVDPISEVSFLDQEHRTPWDKLPSLAEAQREKELAAAHKANLFSTSSEQLDDDAKAKRGGAGAKYQDEDRGALLTESEIAKFDSAAAAANYKLMPSSIAHTSRVTVTSPELKKSDLEVVFAHGKSEENKRSQKLLDDALARLKDQDPHLVSLPPKKEVPHIRALDKMDTDMPSGLGILYPLRAKLLVQKPQMVREKLVLREQAMAIRQEKVQEMVYETRAAQADYATASYACRDTYQLQQAEPQVLERAVLREAPRLKQAIMMGGGGGGGPAGRGRGGPPPRAGGGAMLGLRSAISTRAGAMRSSSIQGSDNDSSDASLASSASDFSDDEDVVPMNYIAKPGQVTKVVGGKMRVMAEKKKEALFDDDDEDEDEGDMDGFGLFGDDEPCKGAPCAAAAAMDEDFRGIEEELDEDDNFAAFADLEELSAPMPTSNKKSAPAKKDMKAINDELDDLLAELDDGDMAEAKGDVDADLDALLAGLDDLKVSSKKMSKELSEQGQMLASLDEVVDKAPRNEKKKKMKKRMASSSDDENEAMNFAMAEAEEQCKEMEQAEEKPAPRARMEAEMAMKMEMEKAVAKEMEKERSSKKAEEAAPMRRMAAAPARMQMKGPPTLSRAKPTASASLSSLSMKKSASSAAPPPPPPPSAPMPFSSAPMPSASCASSSASMPMFMQQQQQQPQAPGGFGYSGAPPPPPPPGSSQGYGGVPSGFGSAVPGASRLRQATGSRFADVNANLQSVKMTMNESIDRVMERGEKLDTLIERSDDLTAHSEKFFTRSKNMSSKKTSLFGALGSALAGGEGPQEEERSREGRRGEKGGQGFLAGRLSATSVGAPSAHRPVYGKTTDTALSGLLPDEPEEDVFARGPMPDRNTLVTHISVSLRDDTACGSLLSDFSHNPRASFPIQLAWSGETLPLTRTVVLALPGEGKTKTSRDGLSIEKFASNLQVFSHVNKTTTAPPMNSPNCAVLKDIPINPDHVPNAAAIKLVVSIAKNGTVSIVGNGKVVPSMQHASLTDRRATFYIRADDRVVSTSDSIHNDETAAIASKTRLPRNLFGIELVDLPSTTREAYIKSFFPGAAFIEIARDPTSGTCIGSAYVSMIDDTVYSAGALTSLLNQSCSDHSPIENFGMAIPNVPRAVIQGIQTAIKNGFPVGKLHPCSAGAVIRSYLADVKSLADCEMSKESNSGKFLTYATLAEKINLHEAEACAILILILALESLEQLSPSQGMLARYAMNQIINQAADKDKTGAIFRNEDARRRARSLLCKASEFSDGTDVYVVAVRAPVPLDDGERRLCDTEEDLGVDRNSALPSDNFDYATFQKANAVKITSLW